MNISDNNKQKQETQDNSSVEWPLEIIFGGKTAIMPTISNGEGYLEQLVTDYQPYLMYDEVCYIRKYLENLCASIKSNTNSQYNFAFFDARNFIYQIINTYNYFKTQSWSGSISFFSPWFDSSDESKKLFAYLEQEQNDVSLINRIIAIHDFLKIEYVPITQATWYGQKHTIDTLMGYCIIKASREFQKACQTRLNNLGKEMPCLHPDVDINEYLTQLIAEIDSNTNESSKNVAVLKTQFLLSTIVRKCDSSKGRSLSLLFSQNDQTSELITECRSRSAGDFREECYRISWSLRANNGGPIIPGSYPLMSGDEMLEYMERVRSLGVNRGDGIKELLIEVIRHVQEYLNINKNNSNNQSDQLYIIITETLKKYANVNIQLWDPPAPSSQPQIIVITSVTTPPAPGTQPPHQQHGCTV